ncbi:hypothetical protein [Sphingomonas pituitosa]|uniref:hypothetical protein n=1 Tax=Sphingomonas pituitosa TaxID=99597 RepID=UPI0008368231|nr:hypothetical protein [Sphingomonas pituitosa]
MKVVRPLPISLTASSVPEADYPAWDAGTTYALGARVIVAALHRVFESAASGNVGHAPAAGGTSFWLDAGPTNRWAMFDVAAGPATSSSAAIVLTLALPDAVDAIGLVDLQAASVRVQITADSVTLLDTTRGAPAACEVFLGLPAAAARSATITIVPGGEAAVVGKLITGTALDLGTLADAPTVGLTDFSRRETDEFGVTTIADRGWTKRIDAKCLIDDAALDGIQRQLAAIRAQAALWIGEGDFPSLIAYGLYKDLSQVISLQGISTCSLTIEGYPAASIAVPLSDPALDGASDFRVVRPAALTDAALVASSVPEDEYPAYAAGTAYVVGARVILAATHRTYESLTAGNAGNDPATDPAHWLDLGPTNRWAMFDQALGTTTTTTGGIVAQLKPGTFADAIAVLDAVGATVRVQAPGYDQVRVIGGDVTTALFLDLALAAGDTATVTIAGADAGAAVAVGTLLIGAQEGLGRLADEPTIGILDFSVKNTDDFGNTVPLERAWAKRMEAKSQIATAGADALLRRLATLRAKPSLWIGAAELDALTIYGFFRDFTVTLGEQVSTCSVTIEGMAKAAAEVPGDGITLTAYLTNEDHTVPADAAGNVASYAGAGGTFIIRDGANEVQSSFNLTTAANPQGLAVSYDGATYAITGGLDVGEDAGALTIKAVGFGPYSGITATKQFTLNKSRAGGAGAAAKLLSIRSNRQTISYDGSGAPTPADQTITFGVNKQNTSATVYWTITDATGAAVSLSYLSAASGDSVYMTEHNFSLARGSTSGVIVTGALADGTTLSDSISVVAVAAGAKGADAINNVNRVRNSMFERGFAGWAVPALSPNIAAPSTTTFVAYGVPIFKLAGTASAANDTFSLGTASGYFIPVVAGERLAVQVAVESSNTAFVNAVVYWLDANGAQIGPAAQIAAGAGSNPFGTILAGFLTAPAGAVSCRIEVYFVAATPAAMFGAIMKPMISSATASQTAFPPFTAGPSDGAPGPQGGKGDTGGQGNPGAPAVYPKVTRKAVAVEAYSNGVVKSFASANGQLSVMSGSADVTASAFLSAAASGCTGTINTDFGTPVAGQPKGYYQVTDLSADTATLTLSATYGGQTITEIFSVSKLLGGYEIVSSLPNSNLFEGRVVYLMADKKLYRFDGSGWNRSADGADLAPNSVTTNALAAGSVVASTINVTYLSAITQTVGFLTSRVNGQGAGFEMDNNGYRLFAANNVLAIEISV